MSNLSNLTNPDPEIKDASDLVGARMPENPEANPNRNTHDDSKSKENLNDIDVSSFTKTDSVLAALTHFHTLQGIFDHALNHVRAPTLVADRFLPYANVFTKNLHIPALGSELYIGDVTSGGVTVTGYGQANFGDWLYGIPQPTLRPTLQKCCVKWDTDIVSSIMAAAQSTKERVPTDGVRDVRARPEYVLQDWGVFLTDTIDTTYRTIRTDAFARFMYGSYTMDAENPESISIINVGDLRSWLNTHNTAFPLPAETLCLDLTPLTDENVGQLSIFGCPYIINLGKPFRAMTTVDGVIGGVPCATYIKTNCAANSPVIASVLNATYDAQEAELAMFLMSFEVPYSKPPSAANFILDTHLNTIQEQIINYYCSGYKHKISIPTPGTLDYAYVVQSFRLARTMFVMKSAMILGFFGHILPGATVGASWQGTEVINFLSMFSHREYTGQTDIIPIWIPFEFWIVNGADVTLDADAFTVNVNGRYINTKCVVPRSFCRLTIQQWSETTYQTSENYYVPNSSAVVLANVQVRSWKSPALPETVLRYSSLCNTASTSIDPSSRYYIISPVKAGYNANYLVKRSLGF